MTDSKYTGTLTPDNLTLIQETMTAAMTNALSTERCDRPAAEAAVTRLYELNGKSAPAFVWMDSPLGGVYTLSSLKPMVKNAKDLKGEKGQLRDQLRGQLWGQLWDQLGDQLRGQLKEDYRAYYNGFTSWYEAYWTSFYHSGLKIAGLPTSDKLEAFITTISNTGWWYPTDAVAFMTDRPTVLTRDAQARLHGPHAAAIEYADGYTLNAWHGTRLPADFHTKDWTLEAVMQETNTEVRRCAIESTGWDRFIAESGMEPVGTPVPDPGNEPFELALYDLPKALDGLYTDKARVLLCTNGTIERDGTRHRYGLIVPAWHDNPIAAAADLYGVTSDQYAALEARR